MSTLEHGLDEWLSGRKNLNLRAPEDYACHGKRGRQPYRHVVANEVKRMHFSKMENPPRKEEKILYSMIHMDISDVKSYYDVMYPSFKKNYMLHNDDYEPCYDWIVNECLKRIFSTNGADIMNHHRHDVYKCVFDEIGYMLEKNIRDSLSIQKYNFVVGSKVKTLVCGPNLMIARSTNG